MDIAAIIATIAKDSTSVAGTVALTIGIIISLKFIDLAFGRMEKNFDKRERIKGILKRENANEHIQDILNTALATLGGDRLQVIEFTNTVKTVASLPFKYMSVTYESYALGKQPAADTIKNELTTLHSTFLSRLYINSFFALNISRPDDKITPATYSLMGKRFASQSLYVTITDRKSKEMIGLLSYDISSRDGFSEVVITTLRKLAAQLSVYLTLWDD